ncbi:MAG: hypothetical protein IPK87_01470 [Planctomycetes bacterium]|nr:hypothetical protein [Planctomycetota bacterium]
MADIAYPFNNNGSRVKTAEDDSTENTMLEEEARREGRKKKNKLRQYSVVIHKLTLFELNHGESSLINPKDHGITEQNIERFLSVRKDHPERCCLVLVRAGLESLQSKKIEGDASDADMILCYVMKADGWKLVWFEK